MRSTVPPFHRHGDRLRALAAGGAVVFLTGCVTTTLYPPDTPVHPRTVFLIDHGRHTSLVMATDAGDLVRYAYGDWRYYADQDTRLRTGVAALLWPTAGTLARSQLDGPADLEVLRSQLRVGVEAVWKFEVAGGDVDRLRRALDEVHESGAASHQYVAAYDMTFAPHPEPYTWINNSATMISRWVEQLGVEVDGWGMVASWEVIGAEAG